MPTIEDCAKLKGRAQRRCVRDVGRNERVDIRQAGKTDRNSNKWNAASTAYNNGIDFSANRMGAWANSASAMAASGFSAASAVFKPNAFGSVFGNGVFAKGNSPQDKDEGSFFENALDTLKDNAFAVAAGGFVLYLLNKLL